MNWKENYLSSKRLRDSDADKNRNSEGDVRTPIESDFGRVIFSEACRRLHDKTQVFPLTNIDIIHSRLTHSMEVMNVGQSFALFLSKNEEFQKYTGLSENDILHDVMAALKTACLVHDIGNPPFGHFGEDAIQNYFTNLFDEIRNEISEKGDEQNMQFDNVIIKNVVAGKNGDDRKRALEQLIEFCDSQEALDFTQFDGNAQGFRVLTKLQYLNDVYGLNLTYACLASSLKYPNAGAKQKNEEKNAPQDRIAYHKHGVFTTEYDYLEKIFRECDLLDADKKKYKRHPLAFLMEASDSICYLVMDIEDAISKGWLTVKRVIEYLGSELKEEAAKDWYEKKLNKIIVEEKSIRKQRVDLRNALFNYLIKKAKDNFVRKIKAIENGDYQEELIFDDANGVAELLLTLCRQKVLSQREIQSLEITGDAIISGLFDIYINLLFHQEEAYRKRGKSLISRTIFLTTLHEHLYQSGKVGDIAEIDPEYEKFDVNEFSVGERLRIIRDFVVCMTDKFALNHYRKLSGQQIQ